MKTVFTTKWRKLEGAGTTFQQFLGELQVRVKRQWHTVEF
jgi:hypothetical protein